MAEGVAAAVRRRQRERQPRVLLYDRSGVPRALAPAEPGYDELLETAEAMIDLAVSREGGSEDDGERRPARGRRARAERER